MASFEHRMRELEKTKGIADKEYIRAVIKEAALLPVYLDGIENSTAPDDFTDIISYFGFIFTAQQYITISELHLLRDRKMNIDLQSEWLADIAGDRICPEIMNFTCGLYYRALNEPVIEKLFSLNYGAFIEEIQSMNPDKGERVYRKTVKRLDDSDIDLNETFGGIFERIRQGLFIKWIPSQDIEVFRQRVRESYSMMKDCIFDPLCFWFSQDNSADKVIDKYRDSFDIDWDAEEFLLP